MTDRSHVAANLITAGVVADTIFLFLHTDSEILHYIGTQTVEFLKTNNHMPLFAHVGFSILLYLIGSFFPDIDSQDSQIGRYFYVPIPHRTWLHAIYIPAMFCIAGIRYRTLFFFGLGIFFHDFWDSFSRTGINWFYPIKNKHHIFKLYYTGKPSEYILLGVILTLSVIYTVFCFQYAYNFIPIGSPSELGTVSLAGTQFCL